MKSVSCVFGFVFALAATSLAEDLTIAAGETYDLPETTNYATVVVHGTLNIPSGLKLTAANVSLGPDAGDSAVINVLGNAAGSLNVTGKVTVGENGGTGKIVALNDASKVSTKVVSVPTLTVSKNAVAHETGFVDVLEMGKMAVPIAGKIEGAEHSGWNNESSTVTVRLRLRNSRLGQDQAYGKTHFTGAFRLEGYDANSTFSDYNNWAGWTLNNGKMTIKTSNQDVTFQQDGNEVTLTLGANVTWDGVKDIVLSGKVVLAPSASNLLPYGPGFGVLKLSSGNTALNLGNRTQRLNGLDAANGPSKADGAVRGTTYSRLIFGDGDTDGNLCGHIKPAVQVEKRGVGTLTVNGASSCGTMTVSAGTLEISQTFDVETLVVEEGATVVIDGVTVTPTVGACIRGDVVLKNNGRFSAPSTVSCDVATRTEGFASHDSLVKEGAGTYIMAGPKEVAPRIHVKAGTLAFAQGGYHAKLFKFNFTNWSKAGWTDTGYKTGMFYLGEIAFVDADGQRIGMGTGDAAIGTAPADLAAGKAAFGADHTLLQVNLNSGAANLFDGRQYTRVGVTSPLTTAAGGVTLYVRLKDADNPAVAWDFSSCYGGLPKAWTVSASLDNGASWEVLNEATAFSSSDAQGSNWFDGEDCSSSTVPKRFPFNSTNPALAVAGALNLPTMTVQVDAGAVLDFSKVTDARNVNGLVLDLSQNAGVLSNATLAATGTIDLVNVTETLVNREIAFDFADSTGVENLANWSVTCEGLPIRGLTATYAATTKKFTVSLGYVHITESGEGDALAGTKPLIVEIDSGVTYTNTAALTGSGSIVRKGAGTLVCAQSMTDYSGDVMVTEGILRGLVSNAFGTGTVCVKCSTSSTSQVRIGSATAKTAYDNDFVFADDSSDAHPVLYFVTSTQKHIDLNGSVTASGYLAATDSGKSASQSMQLVSFNGPVTAVGQTLSYPADNQVKFADKVTVAKLRGVAGYPRMGRFELASNKNDIGEIELDYISCWASTAGALGGAALHSSGANTEANRGWFSIVGSQTVGWIAQDSRTVTVKYCSISGSATAPATLTLTGGTSVARCQFALNDGAKAAAKLSCVVDAGNDDFVQIFSNSTWTASGDLIVSNGTLRLAGTATAAKMRSLSVAGGAFELESTKTNALESVADISVGAGARLRVASAFATTFAPKTDLRMEKTETELPTIELPDGAAMTANRAWLGAKRLAAGTYTGVGGAEGVAVPWISGSGKLTVKSGGGLVLVFR